LIRYSNAGERLVEKSLKHGLITLEVFEKISNYFNFCKNILKSLDTTLHPREINPLLISIGESPIKQGCSAKKILKRPAIAIKQLLQKPLLAAAGQIPSYFAEEMFMEAEAIVKYDGYIKRQLKQIKKMQKQEHINIPIGFDYLKMSGLSKEAREKLNTVKPETLGQAFRVSGVSPADASVLSVYLSK
jgi:tRNA uridine 5-carboxymethylaminomethyl modification enzyme